MNLKNIKMNDFGAAAPEEVASAVIKDISGLDYNDWIAIIGYYNDIADILKEIIKCDDTIIGSIKIDENTDYSKGNEYIILVGADGWVSASPLYCGDMTGYEAKIVYVYDDVHTSALSFNDYELPTIISVPSAYNYSNDSLACIKTTDGDIEKNY